LDGHDVQLATGLQAARTVLATFVPEAILLDMKLDDGSGLTLLEELRADPKFDLTRILALTALDKGTLDAAKIDVLYKPFNMEDLRAVLKTFAGDQS
jgi:DNA-binding response OmpR family regulator